MEQMLIEEKESPWLNIFLSLFGIFFLRILLESFSSPINIEGDFINWQGFFLHIPLSYLAIYLSLVLFIFFVTRERIKKIASFLTFAHLLILLPPLVDVLITGRKPNSIGYQILNANEFQNFFGKVMFFENVSGVTYGMRMAVGLLAFFVGIFIFKNTGKYFKAMIGFVGTFAILFFYAIIPSFLVFFQAFKINHIFLPQRIFNLLIEKSWILNSSGLNMEIAYDVVMAQLFFLLVAIQLLAVFYFFKKDVWLLVFQNIRAERILNYGILVVIGILVAQKNAGALNFNNVINLITIFVFGLLVVANALVAIFVNDLRDVSIDRISNKERPLAAGRIKKKEWLTICFGFLIFLIYGLLLFNSRVVFFMLLTQLLFFVYSVEPLRLRMNFISASLVIGATTASMALAGFFLVSADDSIYAFPLKILLAVFLSQAILSNMKDIKDYEGDKKEGVRTLPVILGIDRSKKVIALLYALVFISIPLAFNLSQMKVTSLFFALLVYYLFTKKEYREKYIFYTMFLYLLFLAKAIY